jgi:hypothetical protein
MFCIVTVVSYGYCIGTMVSVYDYIVAVVSVHVLYCEHGKCTCLYRE